jgi:hypothetical protein
MVVAVKQANPKISSSKGERVYNLAKYITQPERENKTEKCIHSGSRGFFSEHLISQIQEMTALALESVRSKDPIRHDVISFREGEIPTAAQVEEIADLYLKELGLVDHQCIYGLHADTDDFHIHLETNVVHPDTHKVVVINKGFDHEALQKVCARLEHAQGWTPENKSRYHVLENGQMSERPVARERTSEPSTSAKSMESRTGTKSAERIVIEDATPILVKAKTWRELHDRLGAVAIRYERTGGGATIFVGDVGVKASVIKNRAIRFGELQKNLGPFEPFSQKVPNVYTIHRLDNDIDKAAKQDVGADEFVAGNRLRRLSECRMAVRSANGQEHRKGVLQIDARAGRHSVVVVRRAEAERGSERDRSKEPLNPAQSNRETGWREYVNARSEHYKSRRVETEGLRRRHERECAELKESLARDLADRLPKGVYRAGLTNVMRALIAGEHAKRRLEIKERHAASRDAHKARFPQFPGSYEDWLVLRGEHDKAQEWRYRQNPADQPCTIRGFDSFKPKRIDLSDFESESVGQSVIYRHAKTGVDAFVDKGKSIVIGDWRDAGVTLAALQLASANWSRGVFVTGNDEYKQMCVEIAVCEGMTILNPELQSAVAAERQRVQIEKDEDLRVAQAAQQATDAERQRTQGEQGAALQAAQRDDALAADIERDAAATLAAKGNHRDDGHELHQERKQRPRERDRGGGIER